MLSIVINSRNDGHGGKQLERLQAFVDGISDYRALLGWEVELVLVEWNPPAGRATLGEILTAEDAEGAEKDEEGWFRIYQVPPEVHDQFENSKVVPFFFHLAHNVGIRRARGEWVLITSQDVLFSERLARWLALENFDRGAYYRAMRFDSSLDTLPPSSFDKLRMKEPGCEVLERVALLAENVARVRPPKPDRIYTKACGDFMLMHRDHWHALRGFPEWGLFGVYLDGLVVHAAYASGLRQVVLPDSMVAYHVHHESQGMDIFKAFPHLDYVKGYIPLCEGMVGRMEPLVVNGAGWGLGDLAARDAGAPGVWRLEDPDAGTGSRQRGETLPRHVAGLSGRRK